jgi:hypothetical protein
MGMGLCLAARVRHIKEPIELEQSRREPVKLSYIIIAVARHMDLLRIHTRHDVGWIMAGSPIAI